MHEQATTTTQPNTTPSPVRFQLGRLFMTSGAVEALEESGEQPHEFLRRHQTGDFGELSESDRRENELSIAQGFRILSAYRTRAGVKLWVLTEHDRSATTILLPSEY